MQVVRIFNITGTNFPDADVHVSTLDAYFEKLAAAAQRLNLTVVTEEIGDSWIYGAR
jgi:16S rRNA G527 N7-methylase RsmG